MVITFDDIKSYTTDDGIRVVNIYDYLLIDSIKKNIEIWLTNPPKFKRNWIKLLLSLRIRVTG